MHSSICTSVHCYTLQYSSLIYYRINKIFIYSIKYDLPYHWPGQHHRMYSWWGTASSLQILNVWRRTTMLCIVVESHDPRPLSVEKYIQTYNLPLCLTVHISACQLSSMCYLSVEQNVSPVCWAECVTCLLSSMCYLSVEQYVLPVCWAVFAPFLLSSMRYLSVEQNVSPVCWAECATCLLSSICYLCYMCYLSAEKHVLSVCWAVCVTCLLSSLYTCLLSCL